MHPSLTRLDLRRSIAIGLAVLTIGLLNTAKPSGTFSLPLADNHDRRIPGMEAHTEGKFGAASTASRLPLRFEANLGQTAEAVRFLARGLGYTVFLTSTEAVLALTSRRDGWKGAGSVLRLRFHGANPDARVSGHQRLPGKTHYFIGNNPQRWRTNVPAYTRVRYENVYPGVDLVYYGKNGRLEYDLLVAPGADVAAIRLTFEGADDLTIDAKGNLIVRLDGGHIIQQRPPTIYQNANGRRDSVSGRYVLLGDQQMGFEVSAYDSNRSLIIDPVLDYSTYLGGSSVDAGRAVAVDSAGSVYVAGLTASADFPITDGAFQPQPKASSEVFVTKFNPKGSELVYSTYLGGGDQDVATGLAVDERGHAHVAGWTYSTDFPTENPFQPDSGGGFCDIGHPRFLCPDGFVTKLNPEGSALVYSTYLGGTGVDEASDIASDPNGNAYVAGGTAAANFPTVKPFQRFKAGSTDAFVAKFSPVGSALYSTYLGGRIDDYASGIAVDGEGSAFVSGSTDSPDFPTAKPFQPYAGATDAFIAKFTPRGSALTYSTYLGGSRWEYAACIAVDDSGGAYVAGRTDSFYDFPTVNAFQPKHGGSPYSDAFVAKVARSGSGLRYSTYLGGKGGEEALGIAVDGSGNAYVTGDTYSWNFPTVRPLQPRRRGPQDAFVTMFTPHGSRVRYSTYLGGSFVDRAEAIAVDVAGNAYVTGSTESTNFPRVRPFQRDYGGGFGDAFLSKIAP